MNIDQSVPPMAGTPPLRVVEAARVPELCRFPTRLAGTGTIESGPASQGQEEITMERRLAIVLATLFASFSVLWIINFKVVALDQALIMLR